MGKNERLGARGRFVLAAALLVLACTAPAGAALVWTTEPPALLPLPTGYHGAGVLGGRIYIAGGGCIGGFCIRSSGRVFEYDPSQDRWTEMTSLQEKRTFPASAVALLEDPPGSGNLVERLYVMGGSEVDLFPDIIAHTSIEEFDPAAGSWRTMQATLPSAMVNSSQAVEVDGLIYLIGGHESALFELTSQVAVFDPNADTVVGYGGDPLPGPRTEGAAVAVGRTIYYFGGYLQDYGVTTSTCLALDLDSGTWSPIAPMARPGAGMAAIAVGDVVYVLGGWNGEDQGYAEVEVYDTITDSWSTDSTLNCRDSGGGPPVFRGRAGLSVHQLDDGTGPRLYAVGGATGTSEELSCHESSPLDPSGQDVTPPDFNGPVAAFEAECPDPPAVELSWPEATDLQSPPVTYNVYRSRDPAFLPDPAANLVAEGLTSPSYRDTDVVPITVDPRPYFYIVRAVDSAVPPNEDGNLDRVVINVLATEPPPPPDVGTALFLTKSGALEPVLDWSAYSPPPDVAGYSVYRRIDQADDLYGHLYRQPAASSLTDDDPAGRVLFYRVRAFIDCLGIESAD